MLTENNKVKEITTYKHFLTFHVRLWKLKINQHVNVDVNLLQIKNYKKAKLFYTYVTFVDHVSALRQPRVRGLS